MGVAQVVAAHLNIRQRVESADLVAVSPSTVPAQALAGRVSRWSALDRAGSAWCWFELHLVLNGVVVSPSLLEGCQPGSGR